MERGQENVAEVKLTCAATLEMITGGDEDGETSNDCGVWYQLPVRRRQIAPQAWNQAIPA